MWNSFSAFIWKVKCGHWLFGLGLFTTRGEGSCCIRGWVLSSSSEAVVVDSWSLVSPYKKQYQGRPNIGQRAAQLFCTMLSLSSVLWLILVVRNSLSEEVNTATMPGVDHVACVVGVNSSCFSPLLVKCGFVVIC